MPNVTVTIST